MPLNLFKDAKFVNREWHLNKRKIKGLIQILDVRSVMQSWNGNETLLLQDVRFAMKTYLSNKEKKMI